jgi:CheY-like chemotaxis protein
VSTSNHDGQRKNEVFSKFAKAEAPLLSVKALPLTEGRVDVHARRRSIAVGVIDDGDLEVKPRLENLGFAVTKMDDVKHLAEIEHFHVLLVDVLGVGSSFGSEKQGAFLIQQIKQRYPNIIVVAYTASSPLNKHFREATTYADAHLPKDADIAEWTATLDAYVLELTDSKRLWYRYRRILISHDLDTLDILRVEDAFVRSLSRDRPVSPDEYRKTVEVSLPSGQLRAIFQGLVTNAAYDMIKSIILGS